MERAVKQWSRLPRAVLESSSLEMFKDCVDVALRTGFNGEHGGGAGLALDLMTSEFFSNLKDTMAL